MNQPLKRTIKIKKNQRSTDFDINIDLLDDERNRNNGKNNFNNFNLGLDEGTRCTIELETRKYLNNRRNHQNLMNNNNDDNNSNNNSIKNNDNNYNYDNNSNNNNNIDNKNKSSSNIEEKRIVGWGMFSLTSSVPSFSSSASSSITPSPHSSPSPNSTSSPSPSPSPSSPSPLYSNYDSLPFLNSPVDDPVINIVNNGLWRVNIRKLPMKISVNPFAKLDFTDPCIGWLLFRVIDVDTYSLATRWVPKEGMRNFRSL